MPLSRALSKVLLTRPCPNCGHDLQKNGSWFMTVAHYMCEGCQLGIVLSYEGKVELFDAHAHLIDKPL